MYAGRTRKVKTDRRGVRALAEASLLGAYRRPARRLPDPQRQVGGRLLVRDALVRTRTRYISVIRALLRQHGYRVPSGSAEHFVHRVQSLPLPGRFEGQAIARRRPPCQGARDNRIRIGWRWTSPDQAVRAAKERHRSELPPRGHPIMVMQIAVALP